MKKLLFFVLLSSVMNAQTITFKGCIPLFDDQNFVFNKTGTDASGRNIYMTTPLDPGQDCSGLGTCEFKFQWNSSTSKWEFLADSGNGDFVNPFLIYSNTSSSAPNPPDLSLGTWVKFTHAGSNGLTNARGFLLAFDLEQNVADVLIPYTVNDRDMRTVDPRPEFVS